jgi:hypothetical protein
MVGWECRTNPREASGLDPEAVHPECCPLSDIDRCLWMRFPIFVGNGFDGISDPPERAF